MNIRIYSLFRLGVLLLPAALFLPGRLIHAAPPPKVTFTSNTTILAGDGTYEGYDVTVSGCTLTVDGVHAFNSLLVSNNGVVTHDPLSSPNYAGGLNLTITTDCNVTPGSSIDVSSRGYAGGTSNTPAQGPGGGGNNVTSLHEGGGGAYGGEALRGVYAGAPGAPYGYETLRTPNLPGSGGGCGATGTVPGGAGGGIIRLSVGGTLQVDGSISSDGGTAFTSHSRNGGGKIKPRGYYSTGSGSGSGGSVWITANTLSGAGLITANGGYSVGYGHGSGGRIAVYYSTNNFATPLTTSGYKIRALGSVKNYNEYGICYAAAGTIFMSGPGQVNGDLWIHDNGVLPAQPEIFRVENGATPVSAPDTFDNLYVWGGGVLGSSYQQPLNLTIKQNATVALDGWISAHGRGFPGAFGAQLAQGPGAGGSNPATADPRVGAGGSYGGEGGSVDRSFWDWWSNRFYTPYAKAGETYDEQNLRTPTALGSGGGSAGTGQYPGGNGGGAIRLIVNGSLKVDGSVNANGAYTGYGGGGSGGSVWITADTLTGLGSISANGGMSDYRYNGYRGGGGGGGRVAVYYNSNSFATPMTNTGYKVQAVGGYGQAAVADAFAPAGAGTVFMKQTSQTSGDLWVHEAGADPASNAAWYYKSYIPSTVLKTSSTFDNVYVWGGGYLASPYGAPLVLKVLGTCNVGIGGHIWAGGRGSKGGYSAFLAQGPGAGGSGGSSSESYRGAGGGYGGAGYTPGDGAKGGGTYGSAALPTAMGSGGGSSSGGVWPGSSGGGGIQLTVNGTLQVDGAISADGAATVPGTGAGGGSGGSVLLVANTLQGNGLITANGNIRESPGGGGRVALYTSTNKFPMGNVQVIGANNGSIYTEKSLGSSLQSISLSATSIPEGQGTTLTVLLTSKAPTGGITLPLQVSDASVASIPPSITVPAGRTGVKLFITANALPNPASTTIATQLGGVEGSATLNVSPWINRLTFSAPAVSGGGNVTGTIGLNFKAPASGLVVNLVSGDPMVTVPATVSFPANALTATFTAVIANGVTTQTKVPVTATYGPETAITTLIVNPVNVALKSLTLSPSTVIGGLVSVATVSLTGKVPAGGVTVALTGSNPALINVPATLSIPQGKSSAAFVIPTPEVQSLQSVKVTALLGSVSKQVLLKITPTGVSTLVLVPTTVKGGEESSVGVVTLAVASSTDTTITITSNNPAAIPDATIVIPAGELTGTFDIDTTAVASTTNAVITATANGIGKSSTLTIQ